MPRTYTPLAFILILALSLMACQTLETLTLETITSQAAISPSSIADQPATSQPAPSPTAASSITGPEKPNIVFILTDDQDKASIAYMPKLQEYLVKRGISFTNYIVNVSLCCPSRSTTLLGQYAHNTQILTINGNNGGYETSLRLGHENETVATWLQAQVSALRGLQGESARELEALLPSVLDRAFKGEL